MDENVKIQFSKNLRSYLYRDGKNQSDLAKYMRVSSATASDWCNGKKIPRADKLQSLCNWLNITLSELMYGEDNDAEKDKPDPLIQEIAQRMASEAAFKNMIEKAFELNDPKDIEAVTTIIGRLTKSR